MRLPQLGEHDAVLGRTGQKSAGAPALMTMSAATVLLGGSVGVVARIVELSDDPLT
ncbi:MAG: hypothetical protein LC799_06505 [Actinobacteria bacterium]|nr:hypothetical protein [Actinomycetota bacterium]